MSGSNVRRLCTAADQAAVAAQLGRAPRGVVAVAYWCACGKPAVVETAPLLPDGTPFPTLFYLTCPRAVAGCSRLESSGLMAQLTARIAAEPDLAAAYRAAHDDYLARRAALADVPQLRGVSAGGMPDRVKCLHVQLGHALAAGPGVNPIGDEVRARLGQWWAAGTCVCDPTGPDVPGPDVPGPDVPGADVPGADVAESGDGAA